VSIDTFVWWTLVRRYGSILMIGSRQLGRVVDTIRLFASLTYRNKENT
jgi:hypothetical protein